MPVLQRLRILLVFCVAACAPATPVIYDAWLRAAPDGSALGVVYLDVDNPGPDDWITGASSDAHETASLHETTLEGGVSRMRRRERIPLPAGATVSFSPGGLHIMLGKARRRLSTGDIVGITLMLEKGGRIHADAIVSGQKP